MFMWTIEQKSAIDKKNSNILVSASAGSGKTAVLINRVINRVINEEIDIDKILVVTFTNAAALKLKEELLIKLKEEYLENVLKRNFIKKQIKLLNRANISTIHSFCLNLIRTNFDILGIDPDFKVCDEAKVNIYKAKALNVVIEEEYSSNNDMLFLLLEMFKHKEDELCEEILNIYDYIQSFENPFRWLKSSIDKYNNIEKVKDLCDTDYGNSIYKDVISELKLLIAKIDYNIEQLEYYEDLEKIKDTLIEYKLILKDVIDNSDFSWDLLYEKIQKIELKNFPPYKGQMKEKKEEIANFKKNILKFSIDRLKKNIYGDTDKIITDNKSVYKYLEYIYNLLLRFDEKYKEIKFSRNVIDFSDIEHLAYNLLIKDDEITPIALELKSKFVEVYTDEYQDTSKIQEAILNLVSSENNRFMVGDIKQSIYRFRQASPEIFNYKVLNYKAYNGEVNCTDDTKIILAKNFRSRPEVINFVNLIFEKIMSMEAGSTDYKDDEVLKCGRENIQLDSFYNTKINIIDLKKEDNDEIQEEKEKTEDAELIEDLRDFEIESKFIAKDIKELINNKSDKKIDYKDIVILLRNVTGKAQILEKALKDENIPVFSDVSSSIFDSEEIKLVLSFLRVLDNKYQDIFLASIMYSIIGKFSLDELIKIRQIDKKCNLYTCLEKFIKNSDEEKLVEKVTGFLTIISNYEKYSKNLTISEVLIKLFNETGIYYEFILDENYKQRKANLDLILDLTLKYEKENGSFLNEYIDYIDKLSNKTDASNMQAKVIGENENVVRIMTIHKSKGLEFPVVILADTSRKYNQMEFKNKFYLHDYFGIGMNIVHEEYKVTYPSLIKHTIKNKIQNESRSEELRLLYVALTRARDKLIIYGTTKDYFKMKSDIFIMKNNEKIDPYIVLDNDTYLKNILMAFEVASQEEKKIYDLEVINFSDNLDILESKKDSINILDNVKKDIKKYSSKEVTNEISKIKESTLDNILSSQDSETMQRVSVTRLKQGQNFISKIPEDILPEFLQKESKTITPARKGTLIHFILQILDFSKIENKQDLTSFIDECIKNNVISESERKYININDIMGFINSDLGKELKQAVYFEREKEFILKNNSFTKSTIQGVIDLYYENKEGKIVLVDFKTDNILEEEKFVELYKKQLDIYEEAIERLERKKVVKKYIYSFKLGKKIEVV